MIIICSMCINHVVVAVAAVVVVVILFAVCAGSEVSRLIWVSFPHSASYAESLALRLHRFTKLKALHSSDLL